jgi:hypothetical protein
MYVSIGPCPFAPWRREEKPLSRQREGERFLEKLSMNWISWGEAREEKNHAIITDDNYNIIITDEHNYS